MKKLTAIFAAALLLAGCSGAAEAKTGEATIDNEGETVTAKVTVEGDKITSVEIDDTKEGQSKKELKEEYGMKGASPIGKEWYEQAAHLENYIKANGVDGIELDEEGKATNEDILTGCTMNIKTYVEAVKEAQANAK